MDALRFVNVFAGGLAAGGLLIVLISYAKALKEFRPAEIAKLHALFHPPTHRSMQAATILAAASAIAIGAWDDPGWRASTVLVFAGTLGAVIQAVLSRFWVVPWSDEIIAWTETDAPADYLRFLRSWTLLHAGRVVGAVGAFICYLLSLILR